MVKIKDSILIKKLMLIALPLAGQNLINTSVSFLDTLMIGHLGEIEIAAVGSANQIYFLISLFYFGLASGTSIFLSQYYGASQFKEMRKTLHFAFTLCLLGSTIIASITFFFPSYVMKFFSSDTSVIECGNIYLKTVAISYFFSAISSSLSVGFRSISKTSIPLIATFVSLSINAIGNYFLIFGIGIFPSLGVKGAAIATVTARFIEMLILVYFTWLSKDKKVFAFSLLKDNPFTHSFLSLYFKTSFPVLLNEVLWAFGMTLYKVAFGILGTSALATVNIVEAIQNLFFIAVMAIGNAATIVLGNTLGSQEKEKAISWGFKLIFISLFTGALFGLFEIISAHYFVSWFNIDPLLSSSCISSLRIKAVFLPLMSVNMMTIVGILRSGGDTKFAMFSELGGVYIIGVPLAFLSTAFLKLPVPYVYLLLVSEDVAKICLSIPRVISKKWANTIAVEDSLLKG